MKYKYKAFISYSHAADGKLAPILQSSLHRFTRPFYKLRAMYVFRDETTLHLTPELWPSIQEALSKSEFFILLASPDAADSEWVQKEVNEWLALNKGSLKKLLIVLTEGDIKWDEEKRDFDWNITNAIPLNLKGKFRYAPFYLSLSWARDEMNLSLRNPKFLDGIGTLASALLERSKDELVGEDIKQYRIFQTVLGFTILILTVLLIATGFSAFSAFQNAEAERLARNTADSLATQEKLARIASDSSAAREIRAREAAEESAHVAQEQRYIAKQQRLVAEAQRDAARLAQLEAAVSDLEREVSTPLSYAKRQNLDSIRQQAIAFGFRDLAASIQTLMQPTLPVTHRVAVKKPDNSWVGMAQFEPATTLLMGYSDRIELVDSKTLAVLDTLVKISNGGIDRFVFDRLNGRVLYEVRYFPFRASFYSDNISLRDDGTFFVGGAKVFGEDREVYAFRLDTSSDTLLSLSSLARMDEPYGPAWTEFSLLPRWPQSQLDDLLAVLPDYSRKLKDTLESLSFAYKFIDGWHLTRPHSDSGIPLFGSSELENIHLLSYSLDGSFGLYEVRTFAQGWAGMSSPPLISWVFLFSDNSDLSLIYNDIYKRRPVAFSLEDSLAFVGGSLISISDIKAPHVINEFVLDWTRVKSVDIASGGNRIIVAWVDGSMSIFPILDYRANEHRFLPAKDVESFNVTADAMYFVIVRKNGSLETWPVDSFGPDGWFIGN